ncbi:MAG: DUF6356 family protein [Alphaproteobacteria bacterium]|nr:DUF6356 family protein [Alphaproteobacteria bacterium]
MRKLFTEHSASVGESYLQHLAAAAGFSIRLFAGSVACLVHAVFPFLCVRTGSGIIRTLNDRMVTNRASSGSIAPDQADGTRTA